jgi:hypothetical protein
MVNGAFSGISWSEEEMGKELTLCLCCNILSLSLANLLSYDNFTFTNVILRLLLHEEGGGACFVQCCSSGSYYST